MNNSIKSTCKFKSVEPENEMREERLNNIIAAQEALEKVILSYMKEVKSIIDAH